MDKTGILRIGVMSLALLVGSIGTPATAATLYGCDNAGALFSINVNSGFGTVVGGSISAIPPGATDCEFDNIGGTAFSQGRNGAFAGNFFDISTGLPTSVAIANGSSHTGLEYVGTTLYATVIFSSGGASALHTLVPGTGVSTSIGLTGRGPISGLAYDTTTGIMYGIDGGSGPADLVTIALATGVATSVGSTGIQAGSLQFGPDGLLYAGGTGSVAGRLYRISTATGASTFVGPTGFGAVTGLTLAVDAEGACCDNGPMTETECITATKEDCEVEGGLYLGDGTDCNAEVDCFELLVTFDELSAVRMADGVVVSWSTVTEVNNVGFRVLREAQGGREKGVVDVSGLIPAMGNGLFGASYEFTDASREAASATVYFIEDIDFYGKVTRHGPIQVQPGFRTRPDSRSHRSRRATR